MSDDSEIRSSCWVDNSNIHLLRQYPNWNAETSRMSSYIGQLYRRVIKTEERMVAIALIKLGWTPPKDNPFYGARKLTRRPHDKATKTDQG